MVEKYLEIAEAADKAVEKTEEGCCFITLIVIPMISINLFGSFIAKSNDFLFHADNPPVQDYVTRKATHFSIEIYGNVSNEVIEKINFILESAS